MSKIGYNKQDFFNERDELLAGTQLIPSRKFCETFIKRLPDDMIVEGCGYYDDHADYHSWGMALLDDIHQDGEEIRHQLKAWEWVEFYEALKDCKLTPDLNNQQRLIEAITQLGREYDPDNIIKP
jgi:hypothetical protein